MCDYPSKNPARVGLQETAGMACPPTWAPRDRVVSIDGLDALFRTEAEVSASWSTVASLAPSPDDLVECWLSATLEWMTVKASPLKMALFKSRYHGAIDDDEGTQAPPRFESKLG